MAINGNSPIIIIQAYNNVMNKGNGGVAGITKYASNIDTGTHIDLLSSFSKWFDIKKIKHIKRGVPIPFILHEKTGIISVKEQKDISLNIDYEKGLIYKRQRKNSLSIQLEFNIDNIIANTLATLLEYWWGQTEEYNYDISYFNAGNFIKQGTIGNFVKTTSNDNGSLGVINLTLDAGDSFPVALAKKQATSTTSAIIDRITKTLG